MNASRLLARLLAVTALVVAVVVVILAVQGATGGDDGDGGDKGNRVAKQQKGKAKKGDAKVYEVQEGDTLTGIAEKTGVSLEVLQELNPTVDPQALIAGEKLKLR